MADDSSTSSLARQAIDAALKCQWEQALAINLKLIKLTPEDVGCLNRLAKAHCELGQYSQAKKIYEEVLKLDAYNSIAQKNLKKVANCKKNGQALINDRSAILSPTLFLQEPGVTKLVNLIKVAEPNKLLTLSTGMTVNLVAKNRGISVTDINDQYIGVLPDDIAHHLLKLLKGGNKYQALIKSVKSNSLTVLIREVFRSKKFRNQASFLDEARNSYPSDNIPILTDKMEEEAEETDGEELINS